MHIEHLSETRRELLRTLKTEGPSTIARLAQRLELSAEGVRQQLAQLQRDRWVEATVSREEGGRAGRPPALFRLSREGEHLFPKAYDRLNLTLLDAVRDSLGEEALDRVLNRIADEWTEAWAPRVAGLSMPARMQALKSIYQDGDAYMDVTSDGNHLVERNCPYLTTAMKRPVVCCVTVNVLSRLLGAKVVREQRFQDGHGCCAFRVDPSQPIAPDAKVERETPLG